MGDNPDPNEQAWQQEAKAYDNSARRIKGAILEHLQKALGKPTQLEAIVTILGIVREIGESREYAREKTDRLIAAYRSA